MSKVDEIIARHEASRSTMKLCDPVQECADCGKDLWTDWVWFAFDEDGVQVKRCYDCFYIARPEFCSPPEQLYLPGFFGGV